MSKILCVCFFSVIAAHISCGFYVGCIFYNFMRNSSTFRELKIFYENKSGFPPSIIAMPLFENLERFYICGEIIMRISQFVFVLMQYLHLIILKLNVVVFVHLHS